MSPSTVFVIYVKDVDNIRARVASFLFGWTAVSTCMSRGDAEREVQPITSDKPYKMRVKVVEKLVAKSSVEFVSLRRPD